VGGTPKNDQPHQQAQQGKAAPAAAQQAAAAPAAATPRQHLPLEGHTFAVKSFGTTNLADREYDHPQVTDAFSLKVIAGSLDSILLNMSGHWHLFASKQEQWKHTGTHIRAMQRLVHENSERVQATLKNFAFQFGRQKTRRRVHTVGVYCDHGKHRSVAMATLLVMLLEMLGACAEPDHLSKPNWGRRTCGWKDCEDCDLKNHQEARKQLARTALPWLREALTG